MTDTEFKSSVVGKDYLKVEKEGKDQPDIDAFLDYISGVKEMKKEKKFPKMFYDREIEAAKEIIRKIQNKELCQNIKD